MDLNRFTLLGRAAVQPELKQANSGADYCFLKVAVSEKDYKTKKETVQFVSVIVGGKLAAIVCDRVDKGMSVLVEGKIRIRKGDKAKGTYDSINLSADNVAFFGTPKPAEAPDEAGDEPI
jgi:single stranded DNA-binding protein